MRITAATGTIQLHGCHESAAELGMLALHQQRQAVIRQRAVQSADQHRAGNHHHRHGDHEQQDRSRQSWHFGATDTHRQIIEGEPDPKGRQNHHRDGQ